MTNNKINIMFQKLKMNRSSRIDMITCDVLCLLDEKDKEESIEALKKVIELLEAPNLEGYIREQLDD